ncbi:hypothetical protein [Luteibacter jiangsuensis]
MTTSSLRYTALRLVPLHPADRDWLLERLPVAEASALRALLAEPGIERLACVAHDVEPPRPALAPARPTAVPRLPTDSLDRLDPAWASLWLQAAGDDAMDRYLTHATPARAARIAATAGQTGSHLPAKLAESLGRWVPDAGASQ